MSGPQGSDPNQPWQPPGQGDDQRPRTADPGGIALAATAADPGSDVAASGVHAARASIRSTNSRPSRRIRSSTRQPRPATGSPDSSARSPPSTAQPAAVSVSRASTASPAARPVRPAGPVRSAGSVRPARPVPAAVPALRATGQEAFECADRRRRRRDRRARSSAVVLVLGFLGARVLRHHQTGRQQGSGRCAADPHRRDQWLRREERQRRQVQQRPDPTVKKGGTFDCSVSIDGTQKHVTVTFQDNKGTYEVGRPQ